MSNIICTKLLSLLQYLFIRTLISGILYNWSHTCLRMGIAVPGFVVNNLRTIPDCLRTNDVERSGNFLFNGL